MRIRDEGVGDRIVATLQALPANSDGWIALGNTTPIIEKAKTDHRAISRVIKGLKDRGLLEVRMKNARRFEAIRFVDASSPSHSAKETVITVLKSYANKRGWVKGDLHKIARATKLSEHDLIKIMFDLRNIGRLQFRKVGAGASMHLASIRVLSAATPPRHTNGAMPNAIEPERASEQAMREAQPELASIPVPVYPAQAPETAPEPPVEAKPGVTYPLIRALMQRRYNVEQAAKHLELAGLDDQALIVLEMADTLSPFEREVADLVTSLGWPK